MTNMTLGPKGLALIKHFEGFRAQAYYDSVGVLTIGYGTTSNVTRGEVITEAQASNFLARDAAKFAQVINNNVKVNLTQEQFDALVAFTYNVGPANFTSSTLLKVLNAGQFDQVPAQMLRWNKAGGKVLNGLTTRRTAEGVLFSSGKLNF